LKRVLGVLLSILSLSTRKLKTPPESTTSILLLVNLLESFIRSNGMVNEYGVPLHACNGYRHDEHYWAYIRHKNMTGVGPFYEWMRNMMKEKA